MVSPEKPGALRENMVKHQRNREKHQEIRESPDFLKNSLTPTKPGALRENMVKHQRNRKKHQEIPESLLYNIDAFHKQFRLNGEPVEITPNDWTPDSLGETGIQRKKKIAYEKIMKFID